LSNQREAVAINKRKFKAAVSAEEWQNKMMRLLLTYGGASESKEHEPELDSRIRSHSQENLALEQSEMMESKTFMSHNPAFSHGVGH
jgi:hypothetical protein